jgi:hypothetical protein
MIECFNSNWVILLSLLISFIIIKKIYNLLFGETNRNYINPKYDINEKMLPTITAYYVGLN